MVLDLMLDLFVINLFIYKQDGVSGVSFFIITSSLLINNTTQVMTAVAD